MNYETEALNNIRRRCAELVKFSEQQQGTSNWTPNKELFRHRLFAYETMLGIIDEEMELINTGAVDAPTFQDEANAAYADLRRQGGYRNL